MSALTPRGSTRRWRRIRLLVLDRDGWRCRLPVKGGTDANGGAECGAYATHVDHVLPRAQGGSDEPGNLRAACSSCNLRAGSGRQGAVDRRPRRAGWSW